MKKLLKTLTVALALVAAPFVVWRLWDDPDRRKIEPLVGEWRATATDGMQRKYPLRHILSIRFDVFTFVLMPEYKLKAG